MAINQFTRDAAYFQTMRDRGMMINAEDLDLQFNNIVDYLNTKIVPTINDFVQGQFIGVNNPALAGAGLLNIGNGITKWERINSNIFPDYSIPLSKFETTTPFSVIAANYRSIFGPVSTNLNEVILFSRKRRTPIWRKVNTGDIANKTLTGDHIDFGVVKIEHLDAGLRETLFASPRMILDINVNEAYIRGENLQDNALSTVKFANNILQTRQYSIAQGRYTWLDNSIENKHLADNVLIGGYGLDSVQTPLGAKYVSLMLRRTDEYNDDNINYTFTPSNIVNETITNNMIGGTKGVNFYTRLLHQNQFQSGAIQSRHIKNGSVSLKFSSNVLGNLVNVSRLKIPKEALDPIIRAKLGV